MYALLDRGPRFSDGSLEAFAAELQELVLYLREEGHLLSSVDQHFIAMWWERGYPLDTVLDVVLETGTRLLNRKKPPRGLPLKSMKRQVEKAGEQALLRAVGAQPEEAETGASAPAQPLKTDWSREIRSALLDADPGDPRYGALGRALRAIEELPDADLTGGRGLTAVLAISRRYYDELFSTLPGDERSALRREGEQLLGDAVRRMTPEAVEETLAEVARRALRSQDPVLDPDRLRRSWSAS